MFLFIQGNLFRGMGDSSSARNTTAGGGEDLQYEADLELATRLSLETYENEKRRNSSSSSKLQQNTGI